MGRLSWWREARFGMFIHWGLYSAYGGEYEGRMIDGCSEWMMCIGKIPHKEYSKIASSFNPVEFDADAWVRLAKDAGMRYLVVTAKHHDGFAMFHSKCDPYNIVDATPFGRDPLAELAQACKRYDIAFCVYYSQALDWAHPNAWGNAWDYGKDDEKDFEVYLTEKCLPQLTELLTNYGDIGLIWFDMPNRLTPEQSRRIVEHVHALQPNCLISGRIGNGLADYRSASDNSIPFLPVTFDWECPGTLNRTWGYKKTDSDWKTASELIRKMVNIAGKNGNYLLNVGPDGLGKIPEESVKILEELGAWMQTNSASVYGTTTAPLPIYEQNELFTHKPGKLFVHFWKAADCYTLKNMDIRIKRCYMLENPEEDLPFEVEFTPSLGVHYNHIQLPKDMEINIDNVLCIEYEGEIISEPV
ncbi:MAG: alpha-L-fucosidase [Clostridia bacterium]|nr:alpha-L-fucosidase [Clostridia bacterium]